MTKEINNKEKSASLLTIMDDFVKHVKDQQPTPKNGPAKNKIKVMEI